MRRAFLTQMPMPVLARSVRAGHNLALLDETVDGGTVDHDEVGRLAAEKTPRHAAGRTIAHRDCIAGIMGEARHQLVDDILYRRRDQSVQLRRLRPANAREHRGCEQARRMIDIFIADRAPCS